MGASRGPLSRLLRTDYGASSAYGRLPAVGAAAGGGGYAWPANGGAKRNYGWTSYTGNGFDWQNSVAAGFTYDNLAGKWSGNSGYTPPAATVYGAENHDSYLTVPVDQADRQQRLELLQEIASTLVNTLGIGPVNSSFYEDLLSTPSAQQSTQVIAYLLRPVLHVEGSRSRPGIIVVRHCRLYCPFFISLWLSTCK
jgi:hypothetical protein